MAGILLVQMPQATQWVTEELASHKIINHANKHSLLQAPSTHPAW